VQAAADMDESLPPLTFSLPAPRKSLKTESEVCTLPVVIPPVNSFATGFVATALVKQIMFARGRINQSFADLEISVEVNFLCMLIY
jgi:hypothetical protein